MSSSNLGISKDCIILHLERLELGRQQVNLEDQNVPRTLLVVFQYVGKSEGTVRRVWMSSWQEMTFLTRSQTLPSTR